ncbi:MAG: hypothetical protein ACTS4T_01605 [Candidatus Hodgkinia cicadicola]
MFEFFGRNHTLTLLPIALSPSFGSFDNRGERNNIRTVLRMAAFGLFWRPTISCRGGRYTLVYVRSGINVTTKHRRTGWQTFPKVNLLRSVRFGGFTRRTFPSTEHFHRSLNLSPLTFRPSLSLRPKDWEGDKFHSKLRRPPLWRNFKPFIMFGGSFLRE